MGVGGSLGTHAVRRSALLMATEPAVTGSALAKWSFGFFGLCLALSAVASTRPWIEGAPFDPIEDAVHSVAATTMGCAFASGVLAAAFDRSRRPGRGMAAIHSLTLVASVAIPLAMFSYPAIAGVCRGSCSWWPMHGSPSGWRSETWRPPALPVRSCPIDMQVITCLLSAWWTCSRHSPIRRAE